MEKSKIVVFEMNWLEQFVTSFNSLTCEREIEQKLSFFLDHYKVINYEIGYDAPVWRGCKCEDKNGFSNIGRLSYPPKEYARANRLNDEGKPVFYASFNTFTALEEIGTNESDYVHVSGYKIKNNRVRSALIGEAFHVHRAGSSMISGLAYREINEFLKKLGPEAGRAFIYMDAFLSEILRDPNAKKEGYVKSRMLSRLLFEKNDYLEAIIYPSVALERSLNIAILPSAVDKKLEIVGNSVLEIVKKRRYGIYDFKVYKNSIENDMFGNILY